MIEDRARQAGDEQVIVAIVVVISDRATHAITESADAGHGGDVAKREIPQVAIKPVGGRRVGTIGGDGTAIDEIDVKPTVAVKVDEADPSAHGVGQVDPSVRSRIVPVIDSGCPRNVLETQSLVM